MRLSINSTHDQFLQTIAAQMSASPAEALNYLLWELRRQNYSFGSPLQSPLPQAQPSPQTQIGFKSPGAIAQFEEIAELPAEIDPIIARMSQLIENF
ncbi:hypothetical protein [Nostoc sp. UHCC 0870]|uniref:hypothetical protein n=1 Tax=Nostoc sp. UHCC 0870 TaxID=2914041 RepID=UPI001EDE4AA7|nr:hypothetical protein [Nostoc sp. UHCC 0870]UKP01591.1 hypothetical protein L6494_30785 [Nostoc sp. UHCC 0870]